MDDIHVNNFVTHHSMKRQTVIVVAVVVTVVAVAVLATVAVILYMRRKKPSSPPPPATSETYGCVAETGGTCVEGMGNMSEAACRAAGCQTTTTTGFCCATGESGVTQSSCPVGTWLQGETSGDQCPVGCCSSTGVSGPQYACSGGPWDGSGPCGCCCSSGVATSGVSQAACSGLGGTWDNSPTCANQTCPPWGCSGYPGYECTQMNNGPYSTQAACVAAGTCTQAPTYDCNTNGGCTMNQTGTGQYTNSNCDGQCQGGASGVACYNGNNNACVFPPGAGITNQYDAVTLTNNYASDIILFGRTDSPGSAAGPITYQVGLPAITSYEIYRANQMRTVATGSTQCVWNVFAAPPPNVPNFTYVAASNTENTAHGPWTPVPIQVWQTPSVFGNLPSCMVVNADLSITFTLANGTTCPATACTY